MVFKIRCRFQKLKWRHSKRQLQPTRIDDTLLNCLVRAKWLWPIDLKQGYWKAELHTKYKEKTISTTENGLWQFSVIPFGLYNVPAILEWRHTEWAELESLFGIPQRCDCPGKKLSWAFSSTRICTTWQGQLGNPNVIAVVRGVR